MADEHADALAHELPEERELMLDVDSVGEQIESSEQIEPSEQSAETRAREHSEAFDPVRFYLRQAARSRLLERDEELAIARRIDDARCERTVAVLGSPLGLRWLLRLPAAERAGSLNLLEVLAEGAEGEEEEDVTEARRRLLRRIARVRGLVRRGAGRHRRSNVRDPLAEALLALRIAESHVDRLAAELEELAVTMASQRGPGGGAVRTRERQSGLTQAALDRLLAHIRDADQRGRIARQELVEANLRLVIWVARRYAHLGLQLLDLVQEGNIGLMRAVSKFGWRRGHRFSTY